METDFDARFIRFMKPRFDAPKNSREAELIWRLTGATEGSRIIDVGCGWGRITEELAARGALTVGLDASPDMLHAAKTSAAEKELDIDYRASDMRSFEVDEPADIIVLWWTTYGYFDDAGNATVLATCRRALRPGGRLLIDTINPVRAFAEAIANPRGATRSMEVGDDLLVETRGLSPKGDRLIGHRTMVIDGQVSRSTLSSRAYTPFELHRQATDAGFASASFFNENGEPYTWDSYSLIMLAVA